MTNEEKILKILEQQGKALEALQQGQQEIKNTQQEQGKQLDQQGTDIKHLSTVLQVAHQMLQGIQITMATKTEVLSLGLKIDKNHRSTNTRLQHLEEQLGINDPTKN